MFGIILFLSKLNNTHIQSLKVRRHNLKLRGYNWGGNDAFEIKNGTQLKLRRLPIFLTEI